MKNGMPKFAEVAIAYGIKGYRLEKPLEFQMIMKNILEETEAVVFDVNVIENENCYPMVAPGRSNSQMWGLEKQFEKEEQEIKVGWLRAKPLIVDKYFSRVGRVGFEPT